MIVERGESLENVLLVFRNFSPEADRENFVRKKILTFACFFFFFLSEPPDLNNWFSEYVYESTVLSTSDEFEDSLFVERGPEIDELVAEDSNVENEDKLVTIKGFQKRDQQGVVKKGHSNGFVKHNTYEVVKQKY